MTVEAGLGCSSIPEDDLHRLNLVLKLDEDELGEETKEMVVTFLELCFTKSVPEGLEELAVDLKNKIRRAIREGKLFIDELAESLQRPLDEVEAFLIKGDENNPQSSLYTYLDTRVIMPEAELKELDRLIGDNLGLVKKVLADYGLFNEAERMGILGDDLVQAACFGLMRASQGFDPKKAKFSTYAYKWIRQAARRWIDDHGDMVRIPVYGLSQISAYYKAIVQLKKDNCRLPSDEELMAYLEIDEEELGRIRKLIKLRQVKNGDAPLAYGTDKTYFSVIGDNDPGYDQRLDNYKRAEVIARFKGKLFESLTQSSRKPERDLEIFFEYYADFFDSDADSVIQQELADKYEVSRQRINQICENVCELIGLSDELVELLYQICPEEFAGYFTGR